jgi:hypothetical protein
MLIGTGMCKHENTAKSCPVTLVMNTKYTVILAECIALLESQYIKNWETIAWEQYAKLDQAPSIQFYIKCNNNGSNKGQILHENLNNQPQQDSQANAVTHTGRYSSMPCTRAVSHDTLCLALSVNNSAGAYAQAGLPPGWKRRWGLRAPCGVPCATLWRAAPARPPTAMLGSWPTTAAAPGAHSHRAQTPGPLCALPPAGNTAPPCQLFK